MCVYSVYFLYSSCKCVIYVHTPLYVPITCHGICFMFLALGFKYITVAADLVLENVTEPVRFKRLVCKDMLNRLF